jgi:acid phosphatase (class A)
MPRTWPSLTIVAVLAIAGPICAFARTPAPSGVPARYEKTFYIQPSQVDLDDLLAPPPALGSAEEKADLDSVMQAQKDRDANDVVDAEADHERSVFRFADVMGPSFKPEKLPFTTKFFLRVFSDEAKIVTVTKAHFARLRPFMVDSSLMPIVSPKATPSYPSGHTTFAYVTAILLAKMVPEHAVEIFRRAATYGQNRVVAGAHFPTDVEAGRIAGTVIDSVFLHQPRFLTDFRIAQAETRKVLGLPPIAVSRRE